MRGLSFQSEQFLLRDRYIHMIEIADYGEYLREEHLRRLQEKQGDFHSSIFVSFFHSPNLSLRPARIRVLIYLHATGDSASFDLYFDAPRYPFNPLAAFKVL